MTAICEGDFLKLQNGELEAGQEPILVVQVSHDRVIAKSGDGEVFDLSRADLETHGFATNGNPHDRVFTSDGWDTFERVADDWYLSSVADQRDPEAN